MLLAAVLVDLEADVLGRASRRASRRAVGRSVGALGFRLCAFSAERARALGSFDGRSEQSQHMR
jgi:hypothetical protein